MNEKSRGVLTKNTHISHANCPNVLINTLFINTEKVRGYAYKIIHISDQLPIALEYLTL